MLNYINNAVWSIPMLVFLLGTGLVYSVKLKFFQIRHFPLIFKKTFLALFQKKNRCPNNTKTKKGSISQFQAVSAALAASMGTGNIAGVATALTIGGAGAIFWMWVSAVLGMALVYAENYLGIIYRKYKNGKWYGGAMAYLEYGVGNKYLAGTFAVCCAMAALGMGNMTQINSISASLEGCFGIPAIAVGIAAVIICGVIISGGIKRIGSVTQFLIPVLSVIYIMAAVYIILRNYKNIPSVFSDIFKGAFGIESIGGGISGAVLSKSINVGLRRGVFSNEAGLGSSAVLHSPSDTGDPNQIGMWAVFEVFVDTILCCTLTAFAILTTGVLKNGQTGVMLVTEAFAKEIGTPATYFMAVAVSLFAFATVIGWFYCGECGVTYIFGESGMPFYRFIFLAFVLVGALAKLEAVWTVSDIFNGLMAVPNLIGLVILRKKVSSDPIK